MRKWRLDVEHAQCGIDLQDDLPKLLDLRFANDILLLARTAHEALFLLESLMQEFAEVGLLLNGVKTVCVNQRSPTPFAFVDTDGYQIGSGKTGMVDTNGLDASSVSGRLEGPLWTSPTTCKLLPELSLPIERSCVTGMYL